MRSSRNAGVEIDALRNDVVWPVLHLVEDARNVLTEDPDPQQLNPAEEEDQGRGRGEARDTPVGEQADPIAPRESTEDPTENTKTERREDAQGACENEMIPSKARRRSILAVYFGSPAARASRSTSIPTWRKPTQLRIPRTESVAFREMVEQIDDLAGPSARSHRCRAECPDRTVSSRCGRSHCRRPASAVLLCGSAAPHRPRHILEPARDQTGNRFGRILQIAIHDDDGVSRCMLKTSRDGGLVAEVA